MNDYRYPPAADETTWFEVFFLVTVSIGCVVAVAFVWQQCADRHHPFRRYLRTHRRTHPVPIEAGEQNDNNHNDDGNGV